tara:strand:- start:1383 stop:1679 length:297 start_codon:yes stop_codon:yes gene_type:complete
MAKLSAEEVRILAQLRKVSATGGFKFLNTAAHTGLAGYALVCNTDCVFTVFKINGVDSMTKLGLASATIKSGSYMPVLDGDSITDITTTTGDCIIYSL